MKYACAIASLAVSRSAWSYRKSLERKSNASAEQRCWFSDVTNLLHGFYILSVHAASFCFHCNHNSLLNAFQGFHQNACVLLAKKTIIPNRMKYEKLTGPIPSRISPDSCNYVSLMFQKPNKKRFPKDLPEQVICAKNFGNFHQLVVVVTTMKERFLAKNHASKHASKRPHVQTVVVILEFYE